MERERLASLENQRAAAARMGLRSPQTESLRSASPGVVANP
jgi:hypothetical protein